MKNNSKDSQELHDPDPLIEIEARFFNTQRNIEVGVLPYGDTVIHNGPPYNRRQNEVTYNIQFVGHANYLLEIEYAALHSRPCNIVWDGEIIDSGNIGSITGGWEEKFQKWEKQGRVTGGAGKHVLRIYRGAPFPHIKSIKLTLED